MKICLIFLLLISVSCQKIGEKKSVHSSNVARAIVDKKEIRAGLIRQYLPYSFKTESGQMGFDIDLFKAIAKEMNCSIVYEFIEIKDITKSLRSRKVDLVLGVTATKSGGMVVDYSIPYNNYSSSLLMLKDSKVKSLEGLYGKKVAYLNGASALNSYEISQINAVLYKDPKKALEALKKGDVSAIKGDSTIIGALKSGGEYKTIDDVSEINQCVIAVGENQSQLRDMLNASIMKFWENSTWQDIYETWFSEGSLYQKDTDFHINVIPH
jgi:ABC-type amino acid transport substrate-binding protein